MTSINAFNGVGVAGMSRTLHVPMSQAVPLPRRIAAAAAPLRRASRRTATAIVASVDRGTT